MIRARRGNRPVLSTGAGWAGPSSGSVFFLIWPAFGFVLLPGRAFGAWAMRVGVVAFLLGAGWPSSWLGVVIGWTLLRAAQILSQHRAVTPPTSRSTQPSTRAPPPQPPLLRRRRRRGRSSKSKDG